MSDDMIVSPGGSFPLLRGLLIALPFFLFLFYVKVSSEKIKELKEKPEATPTVITTGSPSTQQTPQTKVIIQQDTALVNQNSILIYENKILEQRIDSMVNAVVVTPAPPPGNGNSNMFEDSFYIYKRNYLLILDQLNQCNQAKGRIMMNMKNYRPSNQGTNY